MQLKLNNAINKIEQKNIKLKKTLFNSTLNELSYLGSKYLFHSYVDFRIIDMMPLDKMSI
jgi:hypothetical protein